MRDMTGDEFIKKCQENNFGDTFVVIQDENGNEYDIVDIGVEMWGQFHLAITVRNSVKPKDLEIDFLDIIKELPYDIMYDGKVYILYEDMQNNMLCYRNNNNSNDIIMPVSFEGEWSVRSAIEIMKKLLVKNYIMEFNYESDEQGTSDRSNQEFDE
jgi:hypothetical protein